jgi:protein involved in polysaccharide export with SLBB domain
MKKGRTVMSISGNISFAFFVSLCFSLMTTGFSQDPLPIVKDSTRRESTGSENPSRPNSQVSNPVVLTSDQVDYQLAPSDTIRIVIEDAPELSNVFRISKQGTIPLRYLGQTAVAGKTTQEVAIMIADSLRGRYLKDPKVYVSVEQYNSRTFFIQGNVRTPGTYVIEGTPSLFKLITIAGGLTENHGSLAYIIREKKPDPEKIERARAGIEQPPDKNITKPALPTAISQAVEERKASNAGIEGETEYQLMTAQLSSLFKGRFDQNFLIEPNDLVYIPPRDVFYLAGEVKSPGQYPLKEGTTLRQAISISQGTFSRAATNRGIIFRQDPLTGKQTEIPVDIGAVMKGKFQDILIMPNDVIVVPGSTVKSVTSSITNALIRGAGRAIN